MKARAVLLLALAAAVVLTSAAAAGPAAAKQRVAITMTFHESRFVLSPLRAGALKRDAGRANELSDDTCRKVIRDGQEADVCTGGRWTLTGQRGSITIRTSAEWVNPGSLGCGVAFGTWKVVRGTRTYSGITGGGRSAYDAHCQEWHARHEGFLTVP